AAIGPFGTIVTKARFERRQKVGNCMISAWRRCPLAKSLPRGSRARAVDFLTFTAGKSLSYPRRELCAVKCAGVAWAEILFIYFKSNKWRAKISLYIHSASMAAALHKHMNESGVRSKHPLFPPRCAD